MPYPRLLLAAGGGVPHAGAEGRRARVRAEDDAEQDLIAAIRTVARDEVFLYPSATRLLLRSFRFVGEGVVAF
jgi:hypothetical protein